MAQFLHYFDATAIAIRSGIPATGKVAFVSGNFNVLHPGHLRLLKFAADMADVLVVGLLPDTTPGVSVSGEMRLESVRSLSIVSHAFLLQENLGDFIARLRPDFVVKGKEFENRYNVETAAVERYGGKLVFSSGEAQFSASNLLRHELTHGVGTMCSAEGFPKRHGIEAGPLRTLLHSLSGIRVAVVGDLIVDDYISCDPLGMSQEDPTIVVTPVETQTFVGGAGVVAAHAHSLGAATSFFTVLGDDDTAAYATANLSQMGVEVYGVTDETRPTSRKQRYRAHDKTLLRVNHLRQHGIGKDIAENILHHVEAVLPHVDLLMFADFNYGCLPQDLVDAICTAARARGVLMTADSQASSQLSDIARFKGMMLVTPTEREARLAMRDSASGLAVLAGNLCTAAAAESVIVTLGEGGMLIHGRKGDGEYMTDQLPALNGTPKDVAGAGDSLFTATSMALCAGADIWTGAYLGAVTAACQVSRLGNSPLQVGDIEGVLEQVELE